MYKPTPTQWETQGKRLRNVDLRLVIGFLKTTIRFVLAYPDRPLPMIVEGYRSEATQAKYYAQGRTAPGPIITHSKPGKSKHQKTPSEAIDIGFWDEKGELDYSEENYKLFYALWLLHTKDITWGGNFKKLKDGPHFETL